MIDAPKKRCLIIEIHPNDTNSVIKTVKYWIMVNRRKDSLSRLI